MKILALDPAEKFGWAVGEKEKTSTVSGVWEFKLKRDESFSMKLIRFRSKLVEMIELEKIDVVAFERPSGRMPAAIMSHAKFVAIVEVYCTENNIPYIGYSAKEIKKHATDNGNASKIMMMKAAVRRFKKPIQDDNEADALWILDFAKSNM